MTNEIQPTPTMPTPPEQNTEPKPEQKSEHKPSPFGARLKSARESLGLERKDVAVQLRLNEKVITMMERDRFPADLPITFIRGYIRAYGKLLQIPENEIKKAIEPIKPKPILTDVPQPAKPIEISSSNYLIQTITYLVVFTMIGLVGLWWYNHPSTPTKTENTVAIAPQISQPTFLITIKKSIHFFFNNIGDFANRALE